MQRLIYLVFGLLDHFLGAGAWYFVSTFICGVSSYYPPSSSVSLQHLSLLVLFSENPCIFIGVYWRTIIDLYTSGFLVIDISHSIFTFFILCFIDQDTFAEQNVASSLRVGFAALLLREKIPYHFPHKQTGCSSDFIASYIISFLVSCPFFYFISRLIA